MKVTCLFNIGTLYISYSSKFIVSDYTIRRLTQRKVTNYFTNFVDLKSGVFQILVLENLHFNNFLNNSPRLLTFYQIAGMIIGLITVSDMKHKRKLVFLWKVAIGHFERNGWVIFFSILVYDFG